MQDNRRRARPRILGLGRRLERRFPAFADKHWACSCDDVPWREELTTAVPQIEGGELTVPTAPGWGADVNEEVLRAHPWPRG